MKLNLQDLRVIIFSMIIFVLHGCDSSVHFNIKGRDGGVAITVPRDMLPKRMGNPEENASMVILNLYPDPSSSYFSDALSLEKFRDRNIVVSYKLSKLQDEEGRGLAHAGFSKYLLNDGSSFALVQKKTSGEIIYLECAEAVSKSTKCWYFGEFGGFLTYKLAIPLSDVGSVALHIKNAEEKISKFIDKE